MASYGKAGSRSRAAGAGGDLRQGALHGRDGVGAHVATDSARSCA